MNEKLIKELVGVLVLNGAVSAWREGEFVGSLVLFAVYGALSTCLPRC